RDFARFQQDLVVRVASGFYGVLESKDVVDNEQRTYESLVTVLDRAKAMEQATRMAAFEVDQARQDVLRAEDRHQQALHAYEGQVDDFKKTLGIPVTTKVTLRADALDRLRARGAEAIDADVGRSIGIALSRRLDLLSQRDRLLDAERHMAIAEDALGADVKL